MKPNDTTQAAIDGTITKLNFAIAEEADKHGLGHHYLRRTIARLLDAATHTQLCKLLKTRPDGRKTKPRKAVHQ
jgi:hypothetical protein